MIRKISIMINITRFSSIHRWFVPIIFLNLTADLNSIELPRWVPWFESTFSVKSPAESAARAGVCGGLNDFIYFLFDGARWRTTVRFGCPVRRGRCGTFGWGLWPIRRTGRRAPALPSTRCKLRGKKPKRQKKTATSISWSEFPIQFNWKYIWIGILLIKIEKVDDNWTQI